jgi:hypothetical protein
LLPRGGTIELLALGGRHLIVGRTVHKEHRQVKAADLDQGIEAFGEKPVHRYPRIFQKFDSAMDVKVASKTTPHDFPSEIAVVAPKAEQHRTIRFGEPSALDAWWLLADSLQTARMGWGITRAGQGSLDGGPRSGVG